MLGAQRAQGGFMKQRVMCFGDSNTYGYDPRSPLGERYSAEGRRQRFSDEEIKMLERDWSHFLRQDVEVILFNEDFFAAEPEELQKLADALKIKVRR